MEHVHNCVKGHTIVDLLAHRFALLASSSSKGLIIHHSSVLGGVYVRVSLQVLTLPLWILCVRLQYSLGVLCKFDPLSHTPTGQLSRYHHSRPVRYSTSHSRHALRNTSPASSETFGALSVTFLNPSYPIQFFKALFSTLQQLLSSTSPKQARYIYP